LCSEARTPSLPTVKVGANTTFPALHPDLAGVTGGQRQFLRNVLQALFFGADIPNY
jgi:hypothetical protein